MSFFCTYNKNKKTKCSLQVQNQSFAPTNESKRSSIKKSNNLLKQFYKYKKRTAQFTLLKCNNKKSCRKGSMTIETALVLPIFIYAIMSVMYFLQIIAIQEIIIEGITETGKYASRYAYIYEYLFDNEEEANEEVNYFKKALDTILLKQKLKEYINVNIINNSSIVDGYNGINLFYSSYLEEDDLIDIVVKYKVRIPIIFFHIKDINIVQQVRMKAWTGYERKNGIDDMSQEDIVYIAETGSVYHSTKECTHLKLSIKETYFNKVNELRNQSGGKYKMCEICDNAKQITESSIVYITNTGDRYHTIIGCSGLKRVIIEIKVSQIGSRGPCKRCVK